MELLKKSDFSLKENAEIGNYDKVVVILNMDLDYYIHKTDLYVLLENASEEMKLYIKNYLLIKSLKDS